MDFKGFIKNFARRTAISLISLCVVIILFSLIANYAPPLTLTNSVPVVMSSVYDYASTSSQQQANQNIDKICAAIAQVPPGAQNMLSADQKWEYDLFAGTCSQLTAKALSHKDFFVSSMSAPAIQIINSSITDVSSSLASQVNTPTANANQSKYVGEAKTAVAAASRSMAAAQKFDQFLTTPLKIILLLILFALWYFVSESLDSFVSGIARMFLSMGILALAIWVASMIMVAFYPPDTTPLLLSFTGTSGLSTLDFTQVLLLLPVIVLRLAGDFTLIFGAACVAAAIILSITNHFAFKRFAAEPQAATSTQADSASLEKKKKR